MKSEPSTVWSPSRPRPVNNKPPLVTALIEYDRLQRRRFHVPAHAGLSLWPADWDVLHEPRRYDLTELDGLDVLSEPSGPIAGAQIAAADIFGTAHSFFLVNGASVGLSAAMLAMTRPGEKVLLPRNAHRSVLSGLILSGAQPVWFLPERLTDWGLWGAVSESQIRTQLDAHPDIKALFLTSPTYEGLGSPIAAIAALCRERGVLLAVDEAHGGLWPFSERLPQSACTTPADLVVHSLHKTAGALTQGAIAHLPHGSRLDADTFQQALNTLHTTSPSYLMMASIDAACHFLGSPEGQERLETLLNRTLTLRDTLRTSLRHFQLFETAPSLWDPCKLYLTNPTETGEDWGARLEEGHRLAYESASLYGVLYLANLGLEAEDFEFLKKTLLAEDARLAALSEKQTPNFTLPPDPGLSLPELVLSPREAFFLPGERVSPAAAVGRIAKETVVHCPPGIPVLMPGESVLEEHRPFLPETGLLVLR